MTLSDAMIHYQPPEAYESQGPAALHGCVWPRRAPWWRRALQAARTLPLVIAASVLVATGRA